MATATTDVGPGRPLTIGAVCNRLRDEFPDISISKIRYLEDQGLLAPRRTQGGYRLYSDEDVERLETILRLQRDEFLPLRVIRQELAAGASRRRERTRTAGERPTPGDEAQGREEADADPHRSPNRSEQRNRDRGGQREADEEAPAVAVDPAPKEEGPRHIHEGAEAEREPGRRDRQVVRLHEERADVDERAGPARKREKLSDRPTRHPRLRQNRSKPGSRRSRRRRPLPKEEHARDNSHRDRNHEPGQPPTDLAQQSDERHSDWNHD